MPNSSTQTAALSDALDKLPPASDTGISEVRDVVETALEALFHDETQTPERRALAGRLAGNVRGWTHTTRVRDFLEANR